MAQAVGLVVRHPVGFTTPIEYPAGMPLSCGQSLVEIVDAFFNVFNTHAAEVLPGRELRDNAGVILSETVDIRERGCCVCPSCMTTVLKIIAYITVVIPLLVLIAKAILRACYSYETEEPTERKTSATGNDGPKPKDGSPENAAGTAAAETAGGERKQAFPSSADSKAESGEKSCGGAGAAAIAQPAGASSTKAKLPSADWREFSFLRELGERPLAIKGRSREINILGAAVLGYVIPRLYRASQEGSLLLKLSWEGVTAPATNNAVTEEHPFVLFIASRQNAAGKSALGDILDLLQNEGFISGYQALAKDQKSCTIFLG